MPPDSGSPPSTRIPNGSNNMDDMLLNAMPSLPTGDWTCRGTEPTVQGRRRARECTPGNRGQTSGVGRCGTPAVEHARPLEAAPGDVGGGLVEAP